MDAGLIPAFCSTAASLADEASPMPGAVGESVERGFVSALASAMGGNLPALPAAERKGLQDDAAAAWVGALLFGLTRLEPEAQPVQPGIPAGWLPTGAVSSAPALDDPAERAGAAAPLALVDGQLFATTGLGLQLAAVAPPTDAAAGEGAEPGSLPSDGSAQPEPGVPGALGEPAPAPAPSDLARALPAIPARAWFTSDPSATSHPVEPGPKDGARSLHPALFGGDEQGGVVPPRNEAGPSSGPSPDILASFLEQQPPAGRPATQVPPLTQPHTAVPPGEPPAGTGTEGFASGFEGVPSTSAEDLAKLANQGALSANAPARPSLSPLRAAPARVDTGTAEYPQPAVSAAAARIDVPVSANAGRVATAYAPAGQAAAETRHLAAAFDAKPADRPREEFLAAAGSSAADAEPVDPFAIGTRGATDGGAGAGDPGSDRHTHRQAPADPATAAYAGPIRQVATADSGAGLLDRASGQPAAPDLIAEPTSDGQPLSHAIVRSLKVQWRQGVGEATLRLRPEFLGELTVSLRVQGGGVTAVLQSDSPLVRGWIEAHQADLKKALEGQGLSLENLVIDPEGHPQQRREENPQDESQARHQRRGPKDTRRFEALL